MIMCEQPGSSNVLCGGYSKASIQILQTSYLSYSVAIIIKSITNIMQAYQFVFGLPVSNVQTSSVCDSKGFPLHQMELAYHLCQQYVIFNRNLFHININL